MSLVILQSSASVAQEGCGLFDKALCISALPERVKEEAKLKARTSQLEDSLQLLAYQYQRYVMHCTPHGQFLDSSDVTRITEEIRSLERVIEEYQQLAQQELVAMEEASMTKLNGILLVHLKAYCEANGLSVMVERDALILGPPCADHTNNLLEFMKRR